MSSKKAPRRSGVWFEIALSVPVVASLISYTILHPHAVFRWEIAFWVGAVALTEILPLPTKGRVQLSLNFPILLAVLVLYDPPLAAIIAFAGAFDRREARREVSLLRAVFNRSQIALSVYAGGLGFHALATSASPWYVVVPAVMVATILDYVVNIAIVTLFLRLSAGISLRRAMSMLRVGAGKEFLLNYAGLSLIGIVIVELYEATHQSLWPVVAFIAPLIFARQMFFRTMALDEATEELKDRERVLRALSNRMAEERQDERLRIADYLHDDLQQTLFQLTLRLEMAKKRLSKGDTDGVARDLDHLWEIKQQTSDMVRGLVNDLHHAPIGRRGLPDALERLATDMTRGTPVKIAVEVVDVPLPPPIQLLVYQIAREAVLNAMKHAEPKSIAIALTKAQDGVDLTIRDDGTGFDTSQAQPEGHFGSVMMRERAIVTGGTFNIASAPGQGTTVTAHFPEVWIEEGAATAALKRDAGPDADMPAPSAEQPGGPAGLPSAPLAPPGWPQEDSRSSTRPATA